MISGNDPGSPSAAGSAEDTVRTDTAAHDEFATWLVGGPGPLGGVGGESEAFEQDVVAYVEGLQELARGIDTELREANWFRGVSVAQTQAMAVFVTEARLGLSALGNAAGATGDTYQAADRESQQLFDAVAGDLTGLPR
ncbi:hypothetical protein [Plantactinospora sp. B5E13]|uniref:hypothetical protein n=1 Tax=unclassified Plantactinospora TaxID=2631981 RepID=UPI00325DF33A